MNKQNLLVAVVLLLFTFGCQNASEHSIGNKTATKKHAFKQNPVYVQQIPDSLRTPKQNELVKKLLKMSIHHVKVVDNRMVFDLSRKQFSRTGIPMKYYVLFKKNMSENNKWIQKNNIQDADKMLTEYRRHAREELHDM